MFGLFGPPSKEKFGALVLDKIRALGGPTDFKFDKDAFTIQRGDQRGFLGNTYDAYCQAKGKTRGVILHNFASVFMAKEKSEASFDEIRSQLVLVVRERALFASVKFLREPDSKTETLSQQNEPISNWFARALVLDAPTHMSLVNEEQVKNWGLLPDEVFAIGFENLRNATIPKFTEDQGIFKGTWNDDYDSSRILIPGLFDDLPLRGDPVVTIPNRLTLMVTGSEDVEGIERMLVRAEEVVRSQARSHNPAPLLVKDGVISDFTVDPSSPVFNAVHRARGVATLLYYDDQQKKLETQFEKTGKDVHVAKYTLSQFTGKAVEYRSHSVWPLDVATLLPVSDEVIFYDHRMPKGQEIVARGSWHAVKTVVGDLMLDTQMFPPRFYVSKFPTKEELSRIACEK